MSSPDGMYGTAYPPVWRSGSALGTARVMLARAPRRSQSGQRNLPPVEQ